MKLLLVSFSLIAIFASCSNNKPDPSITMSDIKSDTTVPVHCYLYANANDTISLSIIYIGESVSGTLIYKLHEKDRNQGMIIGTMLGDILIGDYRFMSEGVESTRQVAFKKTNNVFIEGYGEMMEFNGKMAFTDKDSLKFNEQIILTAVKCL